MPEENKHKSTLDFDVRIKKVELGDIVTNVTKEIEEKLGGLGTTRAIAGEAFDMSGIAPILKLISEDVQRTRDKLEIALKAKAPSEPLLKGAQYLLDYTIPRSELIQKLRGVLEQKLPTESGEYLNFLRDENAWREELIDASKGDTGVQKSIVSAIKAIETLAGVKKPARGHTDDVRTAIQEALTTINEENFTKDVNHIIRPIETIFQQIKSLFRGGKGGLQVSRLDMKDIMANVTDVLKKVGEDAPIEVFEDIANYITRAATATKHAHLLSAEMFDKLVPEIIEQATSFVKSPRFLDKFGDAVITAEEKILSTVIQDRIQEITKDASSEISKAILIDIPARAAKMTKDKISPLINVLNKLESEGGLDPSKITSISNLISVVFSRLGRVKSSTMIKNIDDITKAFGGFGREDVISTAKLVKNMEEMFRFISEKQLSKELEKFEEGIKGTKGDFKSLTDNFYTLTEQMNKLGIGVEKVRDLHKQIVLKGNQKNIEAFINKLESIEIKQASEILNQVLAKTTDKEARRLSWKIIKDIKDELGTIQEVTEKLETIITSRETEKSTMDEFRWMLGQNFQMYKATIFEFFRKMLLLKEGDENLWNEILDNTKGLREL